MITLLKAQFALRTMDVRRAATVPALVTFWKPPTYLRREALSGRQESSGVISGHLAAEVANLPQVVFVPKAQRAVARHEA